MPFTLERLLMRWFPIISALVLSLGLGGCSAVRLVYNNAPELLYWWLDAFVDFDGPQTLRLRADLQNVHDWHRREELPLLADVLKNLQTSTPQAVTGEQVCKLYDYLQTRTLAVAERLVPTAAAIIPTLQDSQLEHIAHEYDKRNRAWREEWMEGTAAERMRHRSGLILDRAESFYGRLNASQQAMVRTQIENSVLDAPLQYREMLRRQQDGFQMLRQLRTSRATDAEVQTEVRGLLTRTLNSPDPAYRIYLDKFTRQACANIAQLHNSSTPEQRLFLAQTLRDYEDDARALINRR
jgi:hypothetical protein